MENKDLIREALIIYYKYIHGKFNENISFISLEKTKIVIYLPYKEAGLLLGIPKTIMDLPVEYKSLY